MPKASHTEMDNNTSHLNDMRQKIDKLDDKIYQLLDERGKLATQEAQKQQQIGANSIHYCPEHEAQSLSRIVSSGKHSMDNESLLHIFRSIMNACLALQQPLTIAFLGPKGTFSQAATEKHFGPLAAQLAVPNIQRIFREVEAGNAHYGVVPIENSIEGVVNPALDALAQSSLQICGEIQLPIHQHLLRHPEDTAPITKIYGHQQSLAQCRQWLDQYYTHVEHIAVSSNGQGAKMTQQERGTAAIAGDMAATHYGLKKITQNIEDNPQSTTRFLIVGKQTTLASGQDKTSVLISTSHQPGSLISLLEPFAKHQVNLTLIESRPSQQCNWDYFFFIDMEGHQTDKTVSKALQELAEKPITLTILGSYPRAL